MLAGRRVPMELPATRPCRHPTLVDTPAPMLLPLSELETSSLLTPRSHGTPTAPKVVVVMPAYNAGHTLRLTYEELPKDQVSLVILVDDGSTDQTLEVARDLKLEIFVHNRNYG